MANNEVLLNKHFILDQNDDLICKLENFVKCPRCKRNLRCYRRKISTLDKEECRNVCDHCLNKYLCRKPNTSREKDKRSIGREYSTVKYNKDKVKLWLSRIIDLLESNLILYKTANLSKHAGRRALLATESRYKSRKIHEPETDRMFDFTVNSTPKRVKSEGTTKSLKREIRYADDDIVNIDDKGHLGKRTDDISSVDTFRDNATISSTDSLLKQPAMLQEKLQVLKRITFLDSKDQDTKKDFGEKYKRVSTAKRRNFDQRGVLPNYSSSEIKLQNVRKNLSVTSLKRFNSLDSLTMSISGLTEKTLEQNFRYFFPKAELVKKPISQHISSSEIIKDTIDMLSERAELEKKKKDVEQQKKMEEEENKRLTRLESLKQKVASDIKFADEKKEVIGSTGEKDKIETKSISFKSIKSAAARYKAIDPENIIKSQTSSDLESKKVKDKIKKDDLSEKPHKLKSKKDSEMSVKEESKKDKNKSKKDKDKYSKKERPFEKEQKITDKEEKENLLKIEKEKKLIEKSDKQERLQLEKEEKEKFKTEKVELLQKGKAQSRKKTKVKEKKSKDEKSKEKTTTEEGKKEKVELPQREAITELKETRLNDEKGNEKTTIEKDDKKRLQDMTERKLKEEAYSKMAADDTESEKPISPTLKKEERTTFKELNISQVKLGKHSQDNLILQLVKLKQREQKKLLAKPHCLSGLNVSPILFRAHQDYGALPDSSCVLRSDSDLALDADDIMYGDRKRKEPNELVMGQKIVKVVKSSQIGKKDAPMTFEPLMFKSTFLEESSPRRSEPERSTPPVSKRIDPEATKGVIRYALSDRSFIDKGWTLLPTEKVVRKMNVYRMRPAHPEFDWFEHNKSKKLMHYDTGEKLAEFDDDGKGRWYYRNGRLALDYYDAEETNAQQRFVIYSNGEPDERGRPRPFTIIATFDYLGNGVVFDHSGKIRLKYNQTEGVVLDKSIGPVSHWKWHTLNDPPVLQQVMIDTQMSHKDPEILKIGGQGDQKPRQDNEEMLAIEFDNFIKEKSKKLTQKFKPFQIKMKALKINENFSLKVLDQATVYLIFRDGSTNLKLNIGMILDHKEIVDTDTAEVGEVSNSLERFPAKTDSLAGLQHSVAHAQHVERARLERERRLRPSRSYTSADKLTAAASKPLQQPFRTTTVPSNTSNPTTTTICRCKYRKPSTCNIYYDTRLV